MLRSLRSLCVSALLVAPALAQSSFVNWESPHVHPLDITPDGQWLCAVNTPDARLEVFDLSGAGLVRHLDVPVGLDPVSVRARTATEIWVVNHVSDSISIVDLVGARVRATLKTDDEPADVIFAGKPERAFVTCSQANTLLVFDPANLAAAPVRIPIDGEDPRALARSADGSQVYVAIFESGNSSTILGGGISMPGVLVFPPNVVDHPSGPYGGVNPPPNSGTSFNPPQNPNNPAPPRVGMIVKENAAGQWKDDNNGDWTALVNGPSAALSGRPVGWSLSDHDIAVVDTASLTVSYVRKLMNACMALAVHPVSGAITLVGTDATNEIRYEPIVRGKFLRVELARVDPSSPSTPAIGDLNAHLDYQSASLPIAEREKSIGDPRGIVWNAAGTKGYVTGMGSNNVIVIDAQGNRAGVLPAIDVGEGPTGIVIDEARERLYVLDKFESAISVITLTYERELQRVPFHDPSPASVRTGRKHLYDTHASSGLGQIACASCHVDARMDRLAWDLGDPAGAMKAVTGQNLGANIPGLNVGFQPWHPMKGPMTTQSLQDIIGKEPLHWRGDRAGIEEFNPAFTGLQARDAELTATEMQEFEDFLASITYPPNPFRNFDNTLPASLPLSDHFTTGRFAPAGQPLPNGNAVQGLSDYRSLVLDLGALRCVTCHTLPLGMGTDYKRQGNQFVPIPPGPNGERHHALIAQDGSTNISIKIPQLRNLYEKTGFNATQLTNRAGFGLLHDGSVDSIERFIAEPAFNVTSDQQVANLTAFMLAFSGSELPQGSTTNLNEPPGTASQDSHAAVGVQTTLVDAANPDPGQIALIAEMTAQADLGKVGLVVKGVRAGGMRGWTYLGAGTFQSDRASEITTAAALQASAQPNGGELTYTVVPKGTQVRIGIDRDLDGFFDRDERDVYTDPADPASHPGVPGQGFCFGDGSASVCPCGATPTGSGEGCPNSLAHGGRLSASGTASLSFDTVVLLGTRMTDGMCHYFQGTQQENSGLGTVFGAGLRCVGGTVQRLGTKSNAGGASQLPASGDDPISWIGGITVPGTVVTYQVWYHDANGTCAGADFNLTNGWEITWAP